MFKATWDASRLRKSDLGRRLLKAANRAGREALKSMRAQAKVAVRERVKIRAGFLTNKAFSLMPGKLEWTLGVSGRAVPLGEYPSRQLKKGVKVEVAVGRAKLIPHAFKAATKNGGREGVYIRPTTARYPMGFRLGPSVADAMDDGKIPDRVLAYGAAQFQKRWVYWMDSTR